MSAAETIQKAIEKLQSERDEATSGEWFVTYEKSRWPRVWGNHDGTDADAVAQTEGGVANAHLVVTLHRTIDAQLAILRHQANRGRIAAFNLVPVPESDSAFWDAVGLARAILGEAS